jgi:alcohol dehydrogenase
MTAESQRTPARVTLADQILLFGSDAAGGRLADELKARGWRTGAVFASRSAARTGSVDSVMAAVGPGVDVSRVFADIRDHAPIANSESIASELAASPPDCLLVVGGGKVVDTAKAVAILLAEGGHLEDHCSVFVPPDHYEPKELQRPKLPIVAVPTTLAGAEMTFGGGGTTSEGIKRTFWDSRLAARIVASDPVVLSRTPDDVLLTTGMNALAHCVEGLYSKTANPVSSALALSATGRLATGLDRLAKGKRDAEVYDDLSVGAAFAGMVIANARVGIGHAVCHVLGGRFGIPHGVANGIMLPAVLRFNLDTTSVEQRQFVAAMHLASTDADDPPATVARFRDELRVPNRLRDVGLSATDLDEVAEDLMFERGLYFNPRMVHGVGELRTLLDAAF